MNDSCATASSMRVGTAGWSIPRAWRDAFEIDGELSALEKYARRFSAVEINSSFYRHHRHTTYARWAGTVPGDFRFAVKLPRTITHDQSLVAFDAPLEVFLEEVSGLGDRLGPLLVQLPPSLQFDSDIADHFFSGMRALHNGDIACEPRHPTWFAAAADALLAHHRVARVAADPACVPAAARPGGSRHLVYARLHGSPQMYRSTYSREFLERTVDTLVGAESATNAGARNQYASPPTAWCIFDNTALGAATGDALELLGLIGGRRTEAPFGIRLRDRRS